MKATWVIQDPIPLQVFMLSLPLPLFRGEFVSLPIISPLGHMGGIGFSTREGT